MGYASENGLGWTAPLEWAKGSPWRVSGVDSLEEKERLRMAALLANKELSFYERRVASAFRAPKDLSGWLLSGVDEWGVDKKFAPMRALARAEGMRRFLSQQPSLSDATQAWSAGPDGEYRSQNLVGKLAPSNASTLMFKRRVLPELAAGSILAKGAASFGLLTTGSALWPVGGGAAFIGGVMIAIGVIAKMFETGSTDHSRAGSSMRELWAMRAAMCSEGRLNKLATEAVARAKELGYSSNESSKASGAEAVAQGRSPKELLSEAKDLMRQRDKLLRGGLLSALDRGDQAALLRGRAEALQNAARGLSDQEKSQQTPSLEEARVQLRRFAARVKGEAMASLEVEALKGKSVSRVEGAELAKATKTAVLPAPSVKRASARL